MTSKPIASMTRRRFIKRSSMAAGVTAAAGLLGGSVLTTRMAFGAPMSGKLIEVQRFDTAPTYNQLFTASQPLATKYGLDTLPESLP